MNLLNNDRSNLTRDEWNLLSNITHAYDRANIMSQIKSSLDEQSALVPKLRSKISNSIYLFKNILSTVKGFMERSSFFYDLSTDIRQTLMYNNAELACTINTTFIIRELNALENMTFPTVCASLYGDEIVT